MCIISCNPSYALSHCPLPQAELGERLAHAGSAADPARLRSELLAAAGLAVGSSGGPTPPLEAAKKAYLLTVTTCEMARADLAPLPQLSKGDTCPLAVVLAYLQVGDGGGGPSEHSHYVMHTILWYCLALFV